MAYDRDVFYANCFRIDKQSMPIPSSWNTKSNVMTRDSKRSIKNAKLTAPYLNTIMETSWTYKYLTSVEYEKLYTAYILNCAVNKSVYHTFASVDSNTGKVITYKMYTQADFDAPLYRIDPNTGERYYKDVTFTFVGIGDTPVYYDKEVFKAGDYVNY